MSEPVTRIIEKSRNEQIRIHNQIYEGKPFVDLRVYYKHNGEGWQPSNKGITIPADKAEEIIKAISDAVNIA